LPGVCTTCLHQVLFAGFFRGFASWVIHDVVAGAKFASLLSVADHFRALILQLRYRQDRVRTADAHIFIGEEPNFTSDAELAPVQAIPTLPHRVCDRLALLACSALSADLHHNLVTSPIGVISATRDEVSDEW